MSNLARRVFVGIASLTALLLSSDAAQACAVCYGDPNSELVKGAKAGVLVLAGCVYCVLMMMVGVVGFWAFRARRISRLNGPPPGEEIDDR